MAFVEVLPVSTCNQAMQLAGEALAQYHVAGKAAAAATATAAAAAATAAAATAAAATAAAVAAWHLTWEHSMWVPDRVYNDQLLTRKLRT